MVPPSTGFVSPLVFLLADLSARRVFPWGTHGSPGLSFTLHPHGASKNTLESEELRLHLIGEEEAHELCPTQVRTVPRANLYA